MGERKEKMERDDKNSIHATLYINDSKLEEGVKEHLEEANVSIKSYENIYTDLKEIRGKMNSRVKNLGGYKVDSTLNKSKIWIDKNTCNYALLDAAVGATKTKTFTNPVSTAGSIFESLLDFPLERKKKQVKKKSL